MDGFGEAGMHSSTTVVITVRLYEDAVQFLAGIQLNLGDTRMTEIPPNEVARLKYGRLY